jgi:hypothetical protein
MLMMLVTALPCIGLIMIIVWAFVGENESRKNYYRAMIAWFAIILVVVTGLALIGQGSEIMRQIQQSIQKK